jgi:hypothetical protein
MSTRNQNVDLKGAKGDEEVNVCLILIIFSLSLTVIL